VSGDENVLHRVRASNQGLQGIRLLKANSWFPINKCKTRLAAVSVRSDLLCVLAVSFGGAAAFVFSVHGLNFGSFTKVSLACNTDLCSTRPNTAEWRKGFRTTDFFAAVASAHRCCPQGPFQNRLNPPVYNQLILKDGMQQYSGVSKPDEAVEKVGGNGWKVLGADVAVVF
jgi:hypothetical protein